MLSLYASAPCMWAAMASTNKCLAQINKSPDGDDATWEAFGPVSCRADRAELYLRSALLNLPWPSMAGAFSVEGKSVFLASQYGVMYLLSFATIVTAFASATAFAVLLVMMACRSIWRLLCRRSIP